MHLIVRISEENYLLLKEACSLAQKSSNINSVQGTTKTKKEIEIIDVIGSYDVIESIRIFNKEEVVNTLQTKTTQEESREKKDYIIRMQTDNYNYFNKLLYWYKEIEHKEEIKEDMIDQTSITNILGMEILCTLRIQENAKIIVNEELSWINYSFRKFERDDFYYKRTKDEQEEIKEFIMRHLDLKN
jgi:hypothetical protein